MSLLYNKVLEYTRQKDNALPECWFFTKLIVYLNLDSYLRALGTTDVIRKQY